MTDNPSPAVPPGAVEALKEWRCFHCDEVFTDEVEARDHFGSERDFSTATCQLTKEQIAELRALERTNGELRAENERLENYERLWREADADRIRRIGHQEWWQELDYREGEKLVLQEKIAALTDWRASVTAALRVEGGAHFEDVAKHIRELRAELDRLRAENAPAAFVCKARQGKTDPPQDCDWPNCGCDPYAEKVLAALEEQAPGLFTIHRDNEELRAKWEAAASREHALREAIENYTEHICSDECSETGCRPLRELHAALASRPAWAEGT